MSLSKEEKPPISRDQIDILDYPTSFGELSPIEGFTGPKTPSRRQVLRYFLYLVADNHSVGPSVGWSVPDCINEPNWRNKAISAMETISNNTASTCCVYSILTAPAQQHATEPAYTA